VKVIVSAIKADGASTPEQVLDACLEQMGFLELGDETRQQLTEHASVDGNMNWSDEASASQRIGEMMALISSTTEYQFA
jgi:hypothetical protein